MIRAVDLATLHPARFDGRVSTDPCLATPEADALVAAVCGPHPTEHEWAMGAVWDRMLARRCHLEAS